MRYSDAMTVGELMLKKPVTAAEGDNVEKVYAAMLEGRFRHMPVVAKDNKLIGIVSDRDLRNVLVFVNDSEGNKLMIGDQKLTMSRVMTREPFAAAPEDSIKTAVRIMIKHKFGCLPVCDGEGKLLGLLTETDLLRLLEELLSVKK